jgi:hypothetical protein
VHNDGGEREGQAAEDADGRLYGLWPGRSLPAREYRRAIPVASGETTANCCLTIETVTATTETVSARCKNAMLPIPSSAMIESGATHGPKTESFSRDPNLLW